MQTVTGSWSSEGQVRTIRPDNTPILLESRSGKTGFEYQPWLAATVDDATVIVQLEAPANWHLHVRHRDDGLFISGGLPEVGFQTELRAGEVLDLPEVTLQWVRGDLNAATPATARLSPVAANGGSPDDSGAVQQLVPFPGVSHVDDLKELLPKVRGLGCEVFVLDGSWFQKCRIPARRYPVRTDGRLDGASQKFSQRFDELSNACRANGLGFGIWFEPESVGYTGALHRTHPEWFHRVNGIARSGRTRGILNLGIDAAREHVRDVMVGILRETGATWIKWDFNEDLLRGGWRQRSRLICNASTRWSHMSGASIAFRKS